MKIKIRSVSILDRLFCCVPFKKRYSTIITRGFSHERYFSCVITEEFVAHGANVNCLALGHKSGRVLVTGGDDKKVNLWAVGKPNCIMVSSFSFFTHI